MLISRRLGARRGFTLVEVSIALALAALVLGLVFAVGSRLGKQSRDEAERLAVSEQLTAAAEVLPIDLRGLSPLGGDIASGEARDTSLQLRQRSPMRSSAAHRRRHGPLLPYLGAGGRSVVSGVQDGDTLGCCPTTTRASAGARSGCGPRIGHQAPVPSSPMPKGRKCSTLLICGPPISATAQSRCRARSLRVTRPMRFSFYRASDGHWYLGLRTWNSLSSEFNAIQPVSGPFGPPSGGGGTSFIYFDTTELALPPAPPTRAGSRASRPCFSGRTRRCDVCTRLACRRHRASQPTMSEYSFARERSHQRGVALVSVLYFLVVCALTITAVLFAQRSATRNALSEANGAQLLAARRGGAHVDARSVGARPTRARRRSAARRRSCDRPSDGVARRCT